MARKVTFTIKERKKSDSYILFEVMADTPLSGEHERIELIWPFRDQRDVIPGTALNPTTAGGDESDSFLRELKKIEGIYYVEVVAYWMQIKIAIGFKDRVRDIMLKVDEAIRASWGEGISIKGYSPYVAKAWQEFHFEAMPSIFLPQLVTTMFGDTVGMVIEGSWDGFAEGVAFATNLSVDNITREADETDNWTKEMLESLGGDSTELITATCTSPWKVNRTGRHEDGGQLIWGGKLHFNVKTGMGVIYDPDHK